MFAKRERVKLLDTKPRKYFFAQTAFSSSFSYLTSGVFLTGLAILMNASDVLLGYLSVIVGICGILIIFFSTFLERFKSRKKVTIWLTVLSRVATLFIAAIPAIFSSQARLAVFIPTVIVAFTLQAQTTVALNQWMMEFVDESKSGRYIALRQTMTLVMTVVLSLASGYFLDAMPDRYLAFVSVFAFAGLMSLIEIILLARTPDGAPYRAADSKHKPIDIVRIPMKDRRFLGFVVYILFFYFFLNVADSFTMAFIAKYLALPYQTVNGLYLIMSLPQLFLLYLWGKLSDKKGHEFVLRMSIWLFVGEMGLMFFVSSSTWFIFIPPAFLCASVGNAGFLTAVFNKRYELMPADNRIVYDNFYTAGIGIGFILGPMIGGLIKGGFEASEAIAGSMEFAGIRLLYPIAACGLLLLQIVYWLCKRKLGASRRVPPALRQRAEEIAALVPTIEGMLNAPTSENEPNESAARDILNWYRDAELLRQEAERCGIFADRLIGEESAKKKRKRGAANLDEVLLRTFRMLDRIRASVPQDVLDGIGERETPCQTPCVCRNGK